jgi:uncharacterized membrane protein YgaE (UPF0421/DUF939 family)
VLWAITQASVAAGLAWYIAHDLLGHPDPFFAPIAAAVALSASNVFHAQRAVQNIGGVALGIILGAAVQLLLGTEAIAIGVAVLVGLCVAVLIGQGFIAQGLNFANQTASSAILVMALAGGDQLFQRLQEALIGGGLAVVFSVLLFPVNPLTALRDARIGVLNGLRDVLAQTADTVSGRTGAAVVWPYAAADRLHERLDELVDARSNARHLVLTAPRRWAARSTVRAADRQAAQLALLAGSVLHLARVVTAAFGASGRLPEPAHVAIGDLAAGLTLVESNPDAASAHAAVVERCASDLESTDVVLASLVHTCVDDLQQVINLR